MRHLNRSPGAAAPARDRAPARCAILLAVLAVLGLASAACGGEEPVDRGPADQAPEETSSAPSVSSRIRGDTVVVEMDEYLIDVPDTLPAGRLVLEVRNMGFEEHNLEVHRDSLLFESGRPLNPRETRILEVELEPGAYRLICTVSGHEGRGMSTGLTVVEGRPEA